jgi:hypothetical protein
MQACCDMNGGEEGLEEALPHRHERHGGRAPVRGERPAPMRDADDDGDPLGLRAIGLMPMMMMSDDDDSEDDGNHEALDEGEDDDDQVSRGWLLISTTYQS